MLPAQRRAQILELAQTRNAVRVVDLMAELGVSDATVRRDLLTLAKQGLIDKVHGGATVTRTRKPAPDDGTPPAGPSCPEIGVLIPSRTYYCSRILDGIRAAADQPRTPFTVNLVLSDGQVDTERTLIAKLLEAQVQGLLLMPTITENDNGEYAQWLRELPVPIVLVEREIAGNPLGALSSIRTAHDQGAAAAVAHLHSLGHTRIALISRGSTQPFGLVRAGWESALSHLGIAPLPPIINAEPDHSSPEWATSELDGLLEMIRDDGITAILCHNDHDALTVVQHAQFNGWSIPDELSIVAYDDELAPLASPPLTAVSPPKERVGALAAATLRAVIEEGHGAPARQTRVEPSLVIRSSTAPAPDLTHERPAKGH